MGEGRERCTQNAHPRSHCTVSCVPNHPFPTLSVALLTRIFPLSRHVFCVQNSKPNVLSGEALLNTAGVRATLALSGYLSKEDFINRQQTFVDSLVVALRSSGQSIDASNIIVVYVCYGNDCTTFYSGRRLAAELIEVDFQVNTPDGDARAVFSAMSSDAFLSAVSSELSRVLGRNVEAAYIRAPEKVSESSGDSEDALTDSKKQEEQLNTQAARSTAQFAVLIVVVIVVLLLGIASVTGLYIVWRRRRETATAAEEEQKKAKKDFHADHSLDAKTISDEPEASPLPKVSLWPKTAGRSDIDKEDELRLKEALKKSEDTERRLAFARRQAERVRQENEMLANDIAEMSSFSMSLSEYSHSSRYLDLSLTRATSTPNRNDTPKRNNRVHPDAAIQENSDAPGNSIEDPMQTGNSLEDSTDFMQIGNLMEKSTDAGDSMMLFDAQETPVRVRSSDVSLVQAFNEPDAETGMQEDGAAEETLDLATGIAASGPWFTPPPPPPADASVSEKRRRCSAHVSASSYSFADN